MAINRENKYWIEEARESDNSDDMKTIILSCADHGACIEIHGTNVIATERAVTILQALNPKEK